MSTFEDPPHLPAAASCARDAPGHTDPGLETQQVVEMSFGVQQLEYCWMVQSPKRLHLCRGLILSSKKQRIIEHHITTLLYRGILQPPTFSPPHPPGRALRQIVKGFEGQSTGHLRQQKFIKNGHFEATNMMGTANLPSGKLT